MQTIRKRKHLRGQQQVSEQSEVKRLQSNDLKVSTFKSLSANRTWLPHLRGIGHLVLPLLYDGKSQRTAHELQETGSFHDVVH